jgi:hypothetical protein
VSDDLGVDLDSLVLGGKSAKAELRNALTGEGAVLERTIEGASTLRLELRDPERVLLRSPLFLERTTANVDGQLYELVQVTKTGSDLSVVLEEAAVADLRRLKGALSAKAGTDLGTFALRLIAGAPGVTAVVEPRIALDQLARGSESEPDEDSWTALGRLADERGWRRFVLPSRRLILGSDEWLIKRSGAPLVVRENTAGVDEVDFEIDGRKSGTEASFTCDAKRWTAGPGGLIDARDLGLGSGLWLIKSTSRPLFTTRTTVTLTRKQPALPEPKPEPRDDGGPTTAAKATAGGEATVGPVSASGFTWPATGRISSGYGQRSGRLHAGVDIAVPTGTPIVAAKAGTVTFAGWANGYGNAVYIDHGAGQVTRYAHASKLLVRTGQRVGQGERIALSGSTGNSTGPHLHFEVRVNGSAVDPLTRLPKR